MADKEVNKMDGNSIFRNAMYEHGMTQVKLAEKLGITQASMSGHLNRMRISLDAFTKILDVLGYDVVVTDRETGETKWAVESDHEL